MKKRTQLLDQKNTSKQSCSTDLPENITNYESGEDEHLQSLFLQGHDLVERGNLVEGLGLLSRLLEINPNHYETLQLLGDLYHKMGKETEARQLWELGLSLQPANLTLLQKLGRPGPIDLNYLKKQGKSVECSIIIPVFNQIQFTKRCHEFIKKNTPRDCYEIVVVDNHSTDGTEEFLSKLEDVKVIRNETNLGFAKACNQGARAAAYEFILFLNNDVEVQQGWLTPLIVTLLEDLEVAVVGSKLLYPNWKIQHAGVITVTNMAKKNIPLNPMHVYYGLDGTLPDANIPREYSAVTGACLLTRKNVFQRLGGFDEDYLNGYEDVDYCYKIGVAGYKIVYRPDSVAIHFESQSGPERFSQENKNFQKLVRRWKGKVPIDVLWWGKDNHEIVRSFKTYQRPEKIIQHAANRLDNPKMVTTSRTYSK